MTKITEWRYEGGRGLPRDEVTARLLSLEASLTATSKSSTYKNMDLFFTTITWLGSLYFLLPLSVLLCCVLLWAGKSGHAILLALNVSVTIISVHVAKLMFRRPRPSTADPLVTMPSDWSFPSAHTAQATAFFMSVALIVFQVLPPVWANLFVLMSLSFVGIVGYSRIYLQVHYVSDVLAGMFLAAFIVLAVRLIIPILPWSQTK